MKKLSILSAALSVMTIGACSTPPTAPLPDGNSRVPVNKDMSLEGTAVYPRPPIAQVQFAEAGLTPIPLHVLEPQPKATDKPEAPKKDLTPAQGATLAAIDKARYEINVDLANKAKDNIDDINKRLDALQKQVLALGNVLIVAEYKGGETAFNPDSTLSKAIIDLAQLSKTVSVHGRTDSTHYSARSHNIALARADAVRDYLITHGVNKSKIHVYSLASGDYFAPDNTENGRSLNRRVVVNFIQT
jgi:hypothetical protein